MLTRECTEKIEKKKNCLLVSFQPQWNVTDKYFFTTLKIRKHTRYVAPGCGVCVSGLLRACTWVSVFLINFGVFVLCSLCFLFFVSRNPFWDLKRCFSQIIVTTFDSVCACLCVHMCVCVMSVTPWMKHAKPWAFTIHLCVYAAVKSTNTLINHTKSSKSNVKPLLRREKKSFFLSTKDQKKEKISSSRNACAMCMPHRGLTVIFRT